MTPQSSVAPRQRPVPTRPAPTRPRSTHPWTIASSIVAGILLCGIAAAIATDRIDTVSAVAQLDAPPSAFATNATRELDEFDATLDAMVATLDKGGFWGLLTTSVDLTHSTAHLRSLDVPRELATEWRSGLDHLDASISLIDDAIAVSSESALRSAIESARTRTTTLMSLTVAVS